jgi:hypothetical protein
MYVTFGHYGQYSKVTYVGTFLGLEEGSKPKSSLRLTAPLKSQVGARNFATALIITIDLFLHSAQLPGVTDYSRARQQAN